jgi:hypothetical protein
MQAAELLQISDFERGFSAAERRFVPALRDERREVHRGLTRGAPAKGDSSARYGLSVAA